MAQISVARKANVGNSMQRRVEEGSRSENLQSSRVLGERSKSITYIRQEGDEMAHDATKDRVELFYHDQADI
jgi:hypothetical protein